MKKFFPNLPLMLFTGLLLSALCHAGQTNPFPMNPGKRTIEIRQQSDAEIPADSADIILEAHDLYGYGKIGVQMLLDSRHTAYGKVFDPKNGAYYEKDYSAFQYALPRNADADPMSENVLIDGKERIRIPAGIYDYMIASPQIEAILLFQDQFSSFDDFRFKGGQTYRFLVKMMPGEYGNTPGTEILADRDLAALKIILPENSLHMGSEEDISLQIVNRGNETVQNFHMAYSIDGNAPVKEICPKEIRAGDSLLYIFKSKADLSDEKKYGITAWVEMEEDLIPYNDSVYGECLHRTAATLPYNYAFSDPNDFSWMWSVINSNQDFGTWDLNLNQKSPDGSMGAAFNSIFSGTASNDWLISPPLTTQTGSHHIRFHILAMNPTNGGTGIVDVFAGKSADTSSMRLLGSFSTTNTEWREQIVNFEIEENGVFHIAFRDRSVPSIVFYLDEVTVGKGKLETSPKITIQRLLLPVSNCQLSAATPIGVRLCNKGTGPAKEIVLQYTVNNSAAATDTLKGNFPPDTVFDFYFSQTADLSAVGSYTVDISALCNQTISSRHNIIENTEPLSDFPIQTDFYSDSAVMDTWTAFQDGSWSYDRIGQFYSCSGAGLDNALISRCLSMDGPYRINLSYTGGSFREKASFLLLFGSAGTEYDQYDTLYADYAVKADTSVELLVHAPVKGEYNLLFINLNPNESLRLRQIIIQPKFPYDAAITGFSAPFSPYMPAHQIGGENNYYATVSNLGLLKVTGARLSLFDEEQMLFSAQNGVTIDSGEVRTLKLTGSLPPLSAGESKTLSLEVSIAEEDVYKANNRLALGRIHATDTVYATERLSDFSQAIGESGKPCYVGNIYTLNQTDTLTSVAFALSFQQASAYVPEIGLAVFRMQDSGLSVEKEIFSTRMPRPQGGEWTQVGFPAKILEKGRYYFEIQQLSTLNAGISYQLAENVPVYMRYGDSLAKLDYGIALGIRAHFGQGSKALNHDVAIVSIPLPLHDSALFSEKEEIRAIVENQGFRNAAFRVFCQTGSQQTEMEVSLSPYQKKEISLGLFDLSLAGNHEISIRADFPEDEDLSDNTLTRSVYTWPEPDPYYLDFEYCNDFDTLVFNRNWYSFDRLGLTTNGWWAFDYPGENRPVGFIAFNINRTTPPMTDADRVPGLFPYQGQRFGLAFNVGYPHNETADTWIISPKLKLGENPGVELYVKTHALENPDATLEPFQLWVSETDTAISSFKKLGELNLAPTEWTKVTEKLTEYAGKEVHVALQYVGEARENTCLMIDNLRILPEGAGNESVSKQKETNIRLIRTQNGIRLYSDNEMKQIQLFNIRGQNVAFFGSIGTKEFDFTTETFPSGLYLCRVLLKNNRLVNLKFIVR